MVTVITLPNQRQVTLGEYVRSWRILKTMSPNQDVANWNWFPTPVRMILRAISYGVNDRVNIRGGLVIRADWPHGRIRTRLIRLHARGVLRCECRWCGRPLDRYKEKHARFCDVLCRRSHSL